MAAVQPSGQSSSGLATPVGPSVSASPPSPVLAELRVEALGGRPPPPPLPPEFVHIAKGAPTQLLVNLAPREALAPRADWIQRYGSRAHFLSLSKSLSQPVMDALAAYQRVVDDPHSRPEDLRAVLAGLSSTVARDPNPKLGGLRASLAGEEAVVTTLLAGNLGGLTVSEARAGLVAGFSVVEANQLKENGVSLDVAAHFVKQRAPWPCVLAQATGLTMADIEQFAKWPPPTKSAWAGFNDLEAIAYSKAGFRPADLQDFRGTGAPVRWVKAYRAAKVPFNPTTRPRGTIVGGPAEFGGGQMNTVFRCRARQADGQVVPKIMKYEQADRQAFASRAPYISCDVATSEIARLQGLDLVVESSFVVTEDGRLAVAMAMAPGGSLNVDVEVDPDRYPYTRDQADQIERGISVGSFTQKDSLELLAQWGWKDVVWAGNRPIRARMNVPLDGVDWDRPEVYRAFVDAQNFDAVMGQVDRHLGNLFLDGARVSLIDNTGCLGPHVSPWDICPVAGRGADQALPFTRVVDREQFAAARAFDAERARGIALAVGKNPGEAEALVLRSRLRIDHFQALQSNTEIMANLERVQMLLGDVGKGGPEAAGKLAEAKDLWARTNALVASLQPYVLPNPESPPDMPVESLDCCRQIRAVFSQRAGSLAAALDRVDLSAPESVPAIVADSFQQIGALLGSLDPIGRVIDRSEWGSVQRYFRDDQTLMGRQMAGIAYKQRIGIPVAVLGPDGRPVPQPPPAPRAPDGGR